jgi:hypothetical protein
VSYVPGKRGDLLRAVEMLERRVRDLERTQGLLSGYPNVAPQGVSIDLVSTTDGDPANLFANRFMVFRESSLLQVSLTLFLQSSAIVHKLTGDEPSVGFFDEFVISGHTADLNLLRIHNDGIFTFRFRDTYSQLEVIDSDGNSILLLEDDGTLHLKTGATIVSDL